MNNENHPYIYNNYLSPSEIKEGSPPPRVFSTVESVFAWLAVLFGYLFCRSVPVKENPLGGLLFIIALFSCTVTVLCVLKKKISLSAYAIAISAVILSFSLVVSSNKFVGTLAFLYAIIAYAYFVYTATGNNIEAPIRELCFFDFIKALFVMPFISFGKVFPAMLGKTSRCGKTILKILIGIGLAIIPTLIIRVLLSFDAGFNDILNKIFKFNLLDIFSHAVSILFGIPAGMYIFGLFISSIDKKALDKMDAENCRTISDKIKIMSSASSVIAVLPVLALYVIFFIAQWKNYFSAFVGILPSDTIYAEYARSGFFELCGVAIVNLLLILMISLFTKRSSSGASVAVRIINSVLSFMTIVLICTAMSKMILYIKRFGLTPKRVYASWFIVLLAVIFIFIIIRQISSRFNFAASAIISAILLFAVLGLAGTDSIIAEYNVDRYIDGTLAEVDLEAMSELGDSAIPALVRYRETLEPDSDEYMKLYYYLSEYKNSLDDSFFGITVPRERAKKALAEADKSDKNHTQRGG